MPRSTSFRLIASLSLLLLYSCLTTTIDFEGAAIPPKKTVLKARINATSSASDSSTILISNTRFLFGNDPVPGYTHDATLRLLVDHQPITPTIAQEQYALNYIVDSVSFTIQPLNVPAFILRHPFAPGQHITLEVSRPDYPTVMAQGTIPSQAVIQAFEVDFTTYQKDDDEEKGYKTTLTLRNPSPDLSYFRIRLVNLTTVFDLLSFGGQGNYLGMWEADMNMYIDDEPAFDELQDLLSSNYYPPNCYVFSNTLFATQSHYSLSLWLPHAATLPGTKYYFVLENINADSYRYYLSLMKEKNTNGLFGEPVIRYSNVDGGVGIMHLCTDDRREVLFPAQPPVP